MADFVNKSLQKYTVKMDLEKNKKELYLTMRFSVFAIARDNIDLHKLAIQQLQK